MSRYTMQQASAAVLGLKVPRPAFDKAPYMRTDKVFNVRINGALVAESVTRAAAEKYLTGRAPFTFVQVYLADHPLDSRPRLRLAPALPRPVSLRVSEAERAKLRAKLLADGTLVESPAVTGALDHSAATFAAGAL